MLKIQSQDSLRANAALRASQQEPGSDQNSSDRPAKVRRVRFAESPHQAASAQKNSEPALKPQTSNPTAAYDLGDAADMCHDIFHRSRLPQCSPRTNHPIGHLNSTAPQNDRDLHLTHYHLTTADDINSAAIQSLPSCLPTSVASAVQSTPKDTISITTQLRLALQVSQAVLRFHSTPQWPGSFRQTPWSLSDLYYFDIDNSLNSVESLSASLETTLHTSTKLAPKAETFALQAALAGTLTPPATADNDDDDGLLLYCGIRNLTLYCLGAALLQIGRWETSSGSGESSGSALLGMTQMNPTDVARIRRAAARPSRMGPRYDRLIARCLYCDFGYGADLNVGELQAAVYDGLVCELEGMVGLVGGTYGRSGR